MADNVVISAGSGTTIAADEVVDGTLGTVKVQYVKLMDGTLNGSAKALVDSNGLNVSVAASALPTGAAQDATISGIQVTHGGQVGNAAYLMDPATGTAVSYANPDDVNIKQVNGTTVLAGTGAVGSGAQRVAVAVDSATVAGSAPGTAGTAAAQVVTVQGIASMTAVQVGGAAASGASFSGNPLPTGARAATTLPTAVSDGQAVGVMATKHGKLVAVDSPRELKGSQKTTISASTSETTIVTAVASTFLDLYGLILANTGATTTKVDIRDTTGGSIIATIEVPTLETRGFMLPAGSGFSQTTVNTNWTAQCAASTTAMEVTALYVKNT